MASNATTTTATDFPKASVDASKPLDWAAETEPTSANVAETENVAEAENAQDAENAEDTDDTDDSAETAIEEGSCTYWGLVVITRKDMLPIRWFKGVYNPETKTVERFTSMQQFVEHIEKLPNVIGFRFYMVRQGEEKATRLDFDVVKPSRRVLNTDVEALAKQFYAKLSCQFTPTGDIKYPVYISTQARNPDRQKTAIDKFVEIVRDNKNFNHEVARTHLKEAIAEFRKKGKEQCLHHNTANHLFRMVNDRNPHPLGLEDYGWAARVLHLIGNYGCVYDAISLPNNFLGDIIDTPAQQG